MGHAYVTAEGCDEATVLGVCSSTDESLLDSLMSLHGDVSPAMPPKLAEPVRLPNETRQESTALGACLSILGLRRIFAPAQLPHAQCHDGQHKYG